MRVLVFGASGNLGSHLLPALISYQHTPIAFVRNKNKFESLVPASILARTEVIVGDATSPADMKRVLSEEKIDVFVNCAGTVVPRPGMKGRSNQGDINLVILNAAKEIQQETGRVLRGWFVTGFASLEEPGTNGKVWHDRIPNFRPEHDTARYAILTTPTQEVEWTMLCPSVMVPRKTLLEPYPTPRAGRRIIAFKKTVSPLPSPVLWLVKALLFVTELVRPLRITAIAVLALWTRIRMDDYADRIVEEIGKGGSKYIGARVGSIVQWRWDKRDELDEVD